MSFLRKKGGFSDVIRCDEPNYLVWKWHPGGKQQGQSKRETAIRTNSILKVKTGEVAVFVYNMKDGRKEDYIVGPYDGTLKTKNFPVLSSIIGLWYEGDTPFQAEVFFINTAQSVQIKFGVPFFNVVDPRYQDFQVPVAVRGTMTFKIEDHQGFVRNHQLRNFSLEDLKNKVNDTVVRQVKDIVANAPAENDIPLVAIESKIDLINEKVELNLKDRLNDIFSVHVTGVDIAAIELDTNDESYLELKKITKDIATGKVKSELLDYQEKLRIQREEGQYAQRMGTRQENLGAYQTEIGGQVGVAGAEALGKMGENNAGNVDLGGQGAGFNPATIMAGMAVGSAVGQNIAGTLNKATTPIDAKNVPPIIPVTKFYVAKDGNPTGPFEIETLKTMVSSGSLLSDSLVWKEGMAEWGHANQQSELMGIFPPKISK
ncbi:SPFH domain-containing protein [Acholeplasma laidlawii]|uniref:SPFH domain-containing protein n=1 Tax=Acholeplasma laidlawii TaxID=2148 RepID=UPI0021F7CE51|nr:SPFH domain-containing protein [Acholeplasma laidlawii]